MIFWVPIAEGKQYVIFGSHEMKPGADTCRESSLWDGFAVHQETKSPRSWASRHCCFILLPQTGARKVCVLSHLQSLVLCLRSSQIFCYLVSTHYTEQSRKRRKMREIILQSIKIWVLDLHSSMTEKRALTKANIRSVSVISGTPPRSHIFGAQAFLLLQVSLLDTNKSQFNRGPRNLHGALPCTKAKLSCFPSYN